MVLHITQHRQGFAPGWTEITRFDEQEDNTGISLSVLNLRAGETVEHTAEGETAWLLMNGKGRLSAGGREIGFDRESLFDQGPTCVHVPDGETVKFDCDSDVELTVYRSPNSKAFPTRIFLPEEVSNEPRGKGQVGNACLRYVRTIFDGNNSDPNTELVLGEVITFPGRWSSYPPHHHPQPEIYHYRFTEPHGYGHAELGDSVLKVNQYDTVKIFGGFDHAQCAAPGYGMYYSWVIHHLPGNRYDVPEFTETHTWTTEDGADFWQPPEAKE